MRVEQLARAAAAAMGGRREHGANAEHAANPAVDAERQVVALGAREHVRAVDQRDPVEMGAPHGVLSCAAQAFA